MSSGQAMITSIITELFAHIRENSLILFDEPEVHLHSKCLVKLKNKALRDAEEYGSNHWKVVLKIALADSEEYKNYLWKKSDIIVNK